MATYDSQVFDHPFFRRRLQQHLNRAARDAFAVRDNGCIEFQGCTNSKGYGLLGRTLAHRAAWEAVRGAIPVDKQIHHAQCRNKRCCNPEHMMLVTAQEHGALDAIYKIPDEELPEIIVLMNMGDTDAEIAARFGVGLEWARDLRRGKRRGRGVAAFGVPLRRGSRRAIAREVASLMTRMQATSTVALSTEPLEAPTNPGAAASSAPERKQARIPLDGDLTRSSYRLPQPFTSSAEGDYPSRVAPLQPRSMLPSTRQDSLCDIAL